MQLNCTGYYFDVQISCSAVVVRQDFTRPQASGRCQCKTGLDDSGLNHRLDILIQQFSSSCSLDRDSPFTFTIGAGQVIKGWDQGLLDMCVGKCRAQNNYFVPLSCRHCFVTQSMTNLFEQVKNDD